MNNQMSETFDVHRTVPFIIVHTPGSTLLNATKDDMECYSKILHKTHDVEKISQKKTILHVFIMILRSFFLNFFLDLIFNPNT